MKKTISIFGLLLFSTITFSQGLVINLDFQKYVDSARVSGMVKGTMVDTDTLYVNDTAYIRILHVDSTATFGDSVYFYSVAIFDSTITGDSIDVRTATIDTIIIMEILKPDADEGANIGRSNLRFNETYFNNVTADSIYTDSLKVDGHAVLDDATITAGTIDGITMTNLVDKSATENITGAWTFDDVVIDSVDIDSLNANYAYIDKITDGTYTSENGSFTGVNNFSADSIHADTAVVNYLTVVHAPENTSPDTAATFDGDTVTKTVIVDIESGSYEKLTTDTVLFTTWSNGTATNDLITVSLADDATYDLVDARSGWGFVQLGDNISNAYFTFTSAGAVTLVTNLECTTTQGTNDKLNIYDAGTNVRLENTWAATSQVTINITYNL